MVNYNERLQQIKKAQEELEKQRQQAQRIASQKITRKTTLGVAKKRRAQQAELQKAKQTIQKINQEQQKLINIKGQIENIQSKEKAISDYEAGRAAALKGGFLFGGVKSKAWEEGFREAKKEKASYEERKASLAELKERFGSVDLGLAIRKDFLKELRNMGKIGDYYSGKLDINNLTAGQQKRLINTGYLYEGKINPAYSNGKLTGFTEPTTGQSFAADKTAFVRVVTSPARQDKINMQQLYLKRTPRSVQEVLNQPAEQRKYIEKLKIDAKAGDVESQRQLKSLNIDYRTGKFFGTVTPVTRITPTRLLRRIEILPRTIRTKVENKMVKLQEEIKQDQAFLERKESSEDFTRYRELYRKNARKETTSAQKAELQKLKRKIGRGGRAFSNFIVNSALLTVLSLGYGSVQLINQFRRDPWGTIKSLPPAILNSIKSDLQTLKSGSPYDIVRLGTEYVATSYALGGAGKLTAKAYRGMSRLLPKYVAFKNNQFILRKAPKETFKVRGKPRYLKQRVQKPSFKRPFQSVSDFLKGRKPGQFRKFTKDPGLILKVQTVKSGAMPFAQQFRTYGGKTVTAVNAAADQLTSWLKRKKIIRKPFANEANFPVRVKKILAKFDSGKRLTINEFVYVNKWLQKKVAPNITLLERSLYLDPASGLRINRLGIGPERTASLRDIIRGNFKFRRGKPQVLVFENAKIAKAPKYIQKIVNKIEKRGIKYKGFDKDLARLVEWQTKSGSGLMKPGGSPIYSGGVELEVTLAPGEMIRRIKKIGFTYIDGKRVTFVTAEVWKPTASILKKIKLAQAGKLTSKALKSLEKLLSKKLGRRIKIETPSLRKAIRAAGRRAARRADANIPVLRIRGKGIQVMLLKSYARRIKPIKRKILRRKVPIRGRRTIPRPARTKARTKRPTSKRTTRTSAKTSKLKGRPTRGRRRPPPPPPPHPRVPTPIPGRPSPPIKKKPPVLRLKNFRRKKLKKAIPVYYVVMKRQGKLRKLSPRPFTLSEAKDYLAYRIDHGLSRQAFFIPTKKAKQVVGVPKAIKGYYTRNKRKLRPYKIKYGKRKQLINGYIEKKRYVGDTKSEIRALQYERRRKGKKRVVRKAKPSRRPIKRKASRKINPAQRKALLQRLKKARLARMRKLRKRK